MPRLPYSLRTHLPITILLGVTLLFSCLPLLDYYLVLGNPWPQVLPTIYDETIYYAHVHAIGTGHLTDGNPYFIEQANGLPLVIFGGAWLNAVPMFIGFSFNETLLLNFFLWSIAFVLACYFLLRELYVPPWLAVLGTILEYLQFYSHVFRPVNLQPVLPFIFLFYATLIRFIKDQNARNTVSLGLATGATFYLFAYFWQTVVITLGLFTLYAAARRDWRLLKRTLTSCAIGGLIGLPVPLYSLWLTRHSPYFIESISRFGLVHTHIPMAEVIYSGGWLGLLILAFAALYWRVPNMRDREFMHVFLYTAVGGFGLWVMQGSNFITGILLETGEHLREIILPWFLLGTVTLMALAWKRRALLVGWMQWLTWGAVIVFSFASLYYTYYYFYESQVIASPAQAQKAWQTEETYAAPFAWLDAHEPKPVVVMSDPGDYISTNIPVFTHHYVLFATFAMWQLVPDKELQERYLVAEYFNNPSEQDLKNDFSTYMGRQYLHLPPTIAREEDLCKLLHFTHRSVCGSEPTSLEVIGEPFFSSLEQKFQTDIKPNIKSYLAKYHVSYILKDDKTDAEWHPEVLGAVKVYDDGNFSLYKL